MHSYEYDDNGALTAVKTADGSVTQQSFTHHPSGLMNTASFGGQTLSNLWDADEHRVQFSIGEDEYTSVFDVTAGVPAVIKETTPQGTIYYVREPGGALLCRVVGGDRWYYHFDELGSTRLITDSSGAVTDRYAYDAYGAVISHDRNTGTIDQPYQYVGQLGYYMHYQAPEFGWLQLGVRFYQPEIGRFERRGSPYTYAQDRPTARVQPASVLPPRTLTDPLTGKSRWFPGGRVARLKHCTRPLGRATRCDICLRHSFLLIDGKALGYGPSGAGGIGTDEDSLYLGGASCRAIAATDGQMSCLRRYLRSPRSVPGSSWTGSWPTGDFFVVGPGVNCWEYTHAVLSSCGISADIGGPVPWEEFPNTTPPQFGGV
jgi:YD repeat-containing protein